MGKRFVIHGKAGNPGDPGAFTARGNLEPRFTAAEIQPLLEASVSLGQDLAHLAEELDGILYRAPGITNQILAQKVATGMRIATTNAQTSTVLSMLARSNPGLALALGRGFAEPISGITTYEIREINYATGAIGDVVGRVTITPGAPIVLPAPGRPFQVASNQVADDLTIKLRWGTPDELRRLSLLQHGFNVWRLPKAAAEAQGFHLTPPTPTQLSPANGFQRINEAPVLITKDFPAGGANDPTDRTTYFIADDNRRFEASGIPFNPGDELYYFITARDVLGRDGLASPGGLGRACERKPPPAPTEVNVRDQVLLVVTAGATNTAQRLVVHWRQITNRVNQYWIYQWPNPAMAFTNEALPLYNRVGIVDHIPGAQINAFTNLGAGAPSVPGVTSYWFTVRAVNTRACDPLFSPHSAPASGVLRQREGPVAATGSVLGSCGTPAVMLRQEVQSQGARLPTNLWHYRFGCERRDPAIAWVQFVVTNGLQELRTYGPIYFPPGGNRVEVDYSRDVEFFGYGVGITVTVGTYYGRASPATHRVIATPPNPGERWSTEFIAGTLLATALDSSDPLLSALNGGQPTRCLPANNVRAHASGTVTMTFDLNPGIPVLVQAASNGPNGWVDVGIAYPDSTGIYAISYPACTIGPLPPFQGCVVNLPAQSDCLEHVTAATANGPSAPIRVQFKLTPRTREYRLYRQVNGGALTLIAQGAAAFDPARPNFEVVRTDDAVPTALARLCYFVQLLDEHGNPSPMAFLGCLENKPPKLPRPLLAEPQPAGDTTNPQVALTWFCPTAGVHRFQVLVQRVDLQPGRWSGGLVSPFLKESTVVAAKFIFAGISKVNGSAQFGDAQLTPPLDAGFGPGPQFNLTASVLPNLPYRISVQALDTQGNFGEASEAWEFTWRPAPPPQTVPWPARPLPSVRDFDDNPFIQFTDGFPPVIFYYRVAAVVFTNAQGRLIDSRYPVGIRIGELANANEPNDTVGNTNLVRFQLFGGDPRRVDPNTGIFRRISADPNRSNERLLPIAVYRQQVTNALFPRVSGDVVQVTPLLESIAWSQTLVSGRGVIPDRLIASHYEYSPYVGSEAPFLFLRDPQPVLLGARYQYYLVRFKANREIAEIIFAGEVAIPEEQP